jgi:lipoyl(octanoyl) transferase
MLTAHTPPPDPIVACHLGRVAYGPMWALQRQVQARLIAAKRGEAPPAPHVAFLVEHPPVITLGKSGDETNLLLDEAHLRARGIDYFHVDRGGDVTYHGPGQLVVYPILDLGRFYTDIHRYLRDLEQAIMDFCLEHGVRADRVPGRTGVWVLPDERGPERKICAMGIRCSRWVTMHGLALNVTTDLTHFDVIVPCGISDRGVTSLARETGAPLSVESVATAFVPHLARIFDRPVRELDRDDSVTFLTGLLGTTPDMDSLLVAS